MYYPPSSGYRLCSSADSASSILVTHSHEEGPPISRGAFLMDLPQYFGYLTTLMTRVMLMAVKPGSAGENARSVKEPFLAPGFSTAIT